MVWILILTAFLRIPSLFEPHWYGDEGIYLTIGQALRRGLGLYSQIHDNKPPLIYWLAALADGSQVWLRLILLFWSLATVWVFYHLARQFFSVRASRWVTTIFVILTSVPILEGNIANSEVFFILPTTLAFLLALKQREFLAGLALGMAALFKIPALFEIAIWPAIWLASPSLAKIKKVLLLVAGAAVPIALSLIWFALQGQLKDYVIAAGVQNFSYVGSWKVATGFLGSLVNRTVLAGLATLGIMVLIRTKKITEKVGSVTVWWIIALFAALLSNRPYPHYLMQLAPAFVLGLALAFADSARQKIIFGFLAGCLLVSLVVFKFYTYRPLNYYQNFFGWITKQISSERYFAYFDNQAATNYQVAKTLKNNSSVDDRIFIWGDQPMIFALSGRLPATKYTAKYHIETFGAADATWQSLRSSPPKYILTYTDISVPNSLEAILHANYLLEQTINNTEIWRRL